MIRVGQHSNVAKPGFVWLRLAVMFRSFNSDHTVSNLLSSQIVSCQSFHEPLLKTRRIVGIFKIVELPVGSVEGETRNSANHTNVIYASLAHALLGFMSQWLSLFVSTLQGQQSHHQMRECRELSIIALTSPFWILNTSAWTHSIERICTRWCCERIWLSTRKSWHQS